MRQKPIRPGERRELQMLTEQDKELIERGITGDLTPEEQIQFHSKLDQEEEFRKAVIFQRSMLASLEAQKKVELKTELKAVFARTEPEKPQGSTVSSRWYWLAASLVLLLITFGWLSLRTDNSAIFEAYFDPYPAESMVRGEATGDEAEEVFQLYGGGDYDRAIELMQSRIDQGIDFRGQRLYLGNALLVTGRAEEAIKVLKQVNPENSFYTDAQWYLALAYLKNEQEAQAIEVLEQLLEKRSFYQTSAQELLRELD